MIIVSIHILITRGEVHMATKTKTIKMLLYDGDLSGVMNVSDSAWESGKMYSAPRESINDLISRADCKKYGVYLLLSDQQVYVGQASDLERRTRQHLNDKDWWTQVILMTTKDDSFNASDIDYLESRLIDTAEKAGKLDSDNKKRGNPKKVDEFRQAELEQYIEEALFLLEIIGIRVFKKNTKTKQTIKTTSKKSTSSQISSSENITIPPLPDSSLKIGPFVYAAMENLSKIGYIFDDDTMLKMTTSEWSLEKFHTIKPFLKIYIDQTTDNKGTDGYVRFKTTPYTFGKYKVLISKEWYERQRGYFIDWYNSLSQPL